MGEFGIGDWCFCLQVEIGIWYVGVEDFGDQWCVGGEFFVVLVVVVEDVCFVVLGGYGCCLYWGCYCVVMIGMVQQEFFQDGCIVGDEVGMYFWYIGVFGQVGEYDQLFVVVVKQFCGLQVVDWWVGFVEIDF